MDFENKVFIIDGKRYIIIENINYDGRIFVYIMNSNDELDTYFYEVSGNELVEIDSELFAEKIFPLFIEKFRK